MRSVGVAALSSVGREYHRGRSHTSRGRVGRSEHLTGPFRAGFTLLMRTLYPGQYEELIRAGTSLKISINHSRARVPAPNSGRP
jgi:hypothetical protein